MLIFLLKNHTCRFYSTSLVLSVDYLWYDHFGWTGRTDVVLGSAKSIVGISIWIWLIVFSLPCTNKLLSCICTTNIIICSAQCELSKVAWEVSVATRQKREVWRGYIFRPEQRSPYFQRSQTQGGVSGGWTVDEQRDCLNVAVGSTLPSSRSMIIKLWF